MQSTSPQTVSEGTPRLQLVASSPAAAPPNRAPARSPDRSLLTLWHLLSLDAPTVAATWTVFVAWCAGIRLSPADPMAMFTAVWILYAADRLLDARLLDVRLLDARPLAASMRSFELEERHRFHHRHRRAFLPCLAAATIPLAYLVHRLATPVLHLYTVLATLLAGWLLLVHAQPAPAAATRRLPKEIAVGVFFPAAVFIPTVARAPHLRIALLPGAILFAAVCSLNCLFLYAWEHPRDITRAHATTAWALRRLVPLTVALITGSLAVGCLRLEAPIPPLAHPPALPACCASSGFLLLLLHFFRHKITPVRLRASADLVLLTPAAVLLASRGWPL